MIPIDELTRYYSKELHLPEYPTLPIPAPPKVGRPKRNRKAIKAARKQAAKSRRKS